MSAAVFMKTPTLLESLQDENIPHSEPLPIFVSKRNSDPPGVPQLVRVEPRVQRLGLPPLDGVFGGDVARVAQERRVAPELDAAEAVAELHDVKVLHEVVGRLGGQGRGGQATFTSKFVLPDLGQRANFDDLSKP